MEELSLAEFMKDPAKYSDPDPEPEHEEAGLFRLALIGGGGNNGSGYRYGEIKEFGSDTLNQAHRKGWATIDEAFKAWLAFQASPAGPGEEFKAGWKPGGRFYNRNGVVVINQLDEVVLTIRKPPDEPADG